ncbi:MAG: S26 family signal peptidase [Anaerolineales bacterium]|nr:S26 family signal peptidase [Anaerolineales bacterium]
MLKIIKVTGDSLSPVYNDGDFVLIAKIPVCLFKIKTGDVVVFEHPEHGQLIKKVASISTQEGTLFVIGFHENSMDSRHFGAIGKNDILGKVIWHIKKTA